MGNKAKADAELTIVAYDFLNDMNDLVLHIADNHSKGVAKKTVAELSQDKKILTQFSAMDAFRIGYFHGLSANNWHKDTLEDLQQATLTQNSSESEPQHQ